MARSKKLALAFVLCAAALVLAVLLSVGSVMDAAGVNYENADRYQAGDAVVTGTVRNLDIRWVNGRVDLVYGQDSAISLKETSDKPIRDDMRLRWYLDGETLRVRYAKSGLRLTALQEKTLTLTLPEGIALERADIEATSGELNIPELTAGTLALRVTSGDITAAAAAQTVTAASTSGNIGLKLSGKTESVKVSVTSGNVRVEAEDAGAVSAAATSGDIDLSALKAAQTDVSATTGRVTVDIAEAQRVHADVTAGDVRIGLGAFDTLDVSATAGNVRLKLPDSPGFTARLSTTSGTVENSMPLSHKDGSYVLGDGSGSVTVRTTSGGIRLDKRE